MKVCVCGGGGGGGLTGDSKSGGSFKHFFLVTLYNFQKGGGTEAPQRSPSPSPSVCPVKRKKREQKVNLHRIGIEHVKSSQLRQAELSHISCQVYPPSLPTLPTLMLDQLGSACIENLDTKMRYTENTLTLATPLLLQFSS